MSLISQGVKTQRRNLQHGEDDMRLMFDIMIESPGGSRIKGTVRGAIQDSQQDTEGRDLSWETRWQSYTLLVSFTGDASMNSESKKKNMWIIAGDDRDGDKAPEQRATRG